MLGGVPSDLLTIFSDPLKRCDPVEEALEFPGIRSRTLAMSNDQRVSSGFKQNRTRIFHDTRCKQGIKDWYFVGLANTVEPA